MTGKSLAGPMPPLEVIFKKAGVALTPSAAQRQVVFLGGLEILMPDLEEDDFELPPSVQSLLEQIERISSKFQAGGEHPGSGRVVLPFREFIAHSWNDKRAEGHPKTFNGYLGYVCSVSPVYATAISNRADADLYDDVRVAHTYITGTTNTGKTELLKALVYHDLTHHNAAVIFDPQSNFARAVAAWPEFAGAARDRLVYINPRIAPGYVPAFNPLDASHLSKEGREALAKSLTGILAQVGNHGEWTSQAEMIADNCFKVLVHQPGATLRDLRLAMVEFDKRDKQLPEKVKAMRDAGLRHYNQEVRDFFEYDFLSSQFASSRNSLRAKIAGLLRDDLFAAITSQPSKIFLENLIDQRKIIIFDLGAWGDSKSASAFGRMIIAQLSAMGTRRAMDHGGVKTPVHIYVDEADMFVSSSTLHILSKLRQQGVHMTMAQQTPAYGFSGHDRDQLMNNTAIKFAAGDGQGAMLKMMHAPANSTRRLAQGEFIGRWGTRSDPFKLSVRRDLVGRTMERMAWLELMAHQVDTYYAPEQAQQVMLPAPEGAPAPSPGSDTAMTPGEKMKQAEYKSPWRE